MSIHEVARQLVSHLGATAVAVLAGAKDRKLPYKWLREEGGVTPRPEAQRRLLAAHRMWQTISSAEEDYTARNWFIGANPRLGEQSPLLALRDGEVEKVLAAAIAFVEGTDD